MTNQELTYWLSFALMSGGVSVRRRNELYKAAYLHQPKLSIIDLFEGEEYWDALGMTDAERECFRATRAELVNNAFLVESLLTQGYKLLPVHSDIYPKLLRENLGTDAPIVLFAKGNIDLLQRQSLAIVGSRAATETSLAFTRRIAERAALSGQVVVSGFAKGVDQVALDAALQAGGGSIVVLPQGIQTASSAYKRYYQALLAGQLLFVSQFAPKAPWQSMLAMMRNRTIYGLCTQVYIAQSDAKGGTWEGAKDGLRRGKQQIFVRYPQPEEQNANIILIQRGATAVDSEGMPIALPDTTGAVPEIELTGEGVLELLRRHPGGLSLKELRAYISDTRSDTAFRKFLESLPQIVVAKKKGKNQYYAEGLFEMELAQ